jgi:hypothetical protein
MPNALQPPVLAGQIVFELERFERDGDRLALSGRWYGVRGRRFVRPTLTPLGGQDRGRVLADLEHKPWATEDGESWEAAFPWTQDGPTAKFELSVAPDITVHLPSPGSRRTSRRLVALGRHAVALSGASTATRGWGGIAGVEQQAPAPRDPEFERLETELGMVKAKLQAADGELEAARAALSEREHEIAAVREQLSTAQADRESAAHVNTDAIAARDRIASERDQLLAEREKLTEQLGQVKSHHDALARDREQVITERDQLMIDRDRLVSERTQLRAECGELTTQLWQMTAERDEARQASDDRQSQLDQATAALGAANRERNEAVTARGAALVMRRAVGTPAQFERPATWWKQTLAILALIGVVFAILIVAHVV